MSGSGKPLVTVILPVFRNRPFLIPAVRSILAQDYSPLQIAISDDASPDDAFDVVRELAAEYSGPHKIVLNRNERNQAMGNYNTLMKMADGRFIVIAHDDDISVPHRISRLAEAWRTRRVSMVTSNARRIGPDGADLGLVLEPGQHRPASLRLMAQRWSWMFLGASLSWDREIFDEFGPISTKLTYKSSGQILPFRAALMRGIHYIDEPLIDWRIHADQRGWIGSSSEDKDARKVETVSESLGQNAYQLSTLEEYQRKHPVRRLKTIGIRRLLLAKIARDARKLGVLRNRLMAQGKMMVWGNRNNR